ncbi:hypothetical protein [Stenotrophomonas maltophilia]|uniref:hypothetical protein n=1 Tax=Stenotrophomonas maltophilia TaxID=40324 RepID=UPI003BF777AD
MKADPNEWIDPAIARRLMLEYQNAIGIKGASEIERRIDTYTKLGLHRKTIENWLRTPDSTASPQTLKIVLRFLRTAHFQQIVPRTRDYLDSDARLSRIGAALFDLYGMTDEDLPTTINKNINLAGWWWCPPIPTSVFSRPNYLYIAPVPDHPFSKIHILLDCHHAMPGSGIAYPKYELGLAQFLAHVWTKASNQSVSMFFEKKITLVPQNKSLHVLYLPNRKGDNVPQPNGSHFKVDFQRIDESNISSSLHELFSQWSLSVVPNTGNIAQLP